MIEQQDIFLPQFQIYDYRNPLHISSINMLFMYMSQHEFAPWRGKDLEIDLSLKPKDFEAPFYNSEYLEYDRSILGYILKQNRTTFTQRFNSKSTYGISN